MADDCAAKRIVFGRHAGYTAAGVPLVAQLLSLTCAEEIALEDRDWHTRHVGFDGFLPLGAVGWACCRGTTCTPAEIAAGDCYQRADCWPFGIGPGITRRVRVFTTDVDTCWSAGAGNCHGAELVYDPGDGKWHGDLGLRSGPLHLTFECVPTEAPDSLGKFKLSWTGCQTGSVSAGFQCSDPLVVNFGMIDFPECCDCHQVGSGSDTRPTTDVTASVNVYVAANCHQVYPGRHVAYQTDGIAGIASERPCVWDAKTCYTCATMRCPLSASVAGAGACGCVGGTAGLDYFSGGWEGDYSAACGAVRLKLNCVQLDDPVPPELDVPGCTSCGYVRLSLTVECGADHTGAASVVIPACELENLDETFAVAMSGASHTCTGGTCNYVYIEMLPGWQLAGDSCTGECAECPNAPAAPPSHPTDGQTWSEPCSDGGPVECCTGTITVRVTR